jgi:hypothetical protein
MHKTTEGRLINEIKTEFVDKVPVEQLAEWFEKKHRKIADTMKLSELVSVAQEAGINVVFPEGNAS